MALQNLISASISAEAKEDVLKKIADIKGKLSFLLTLEPDRIQGMVKAGNSYAPFVEKAYNAINAHPQIMAGVFDIEEFKRDYTLSKDLTAIKSQVEQLAVSLNNTLLAANSDAMNAALEVYAAVKQNRDKVPGLSVVSDEMSEFFKKTRRKGTEKELK